MDTFFFLVDGTSGDLLTVDASGTYLAYEADSDESGGGTVTYTITPNFDTSAFDLPSDIEVWYSKRGEGFPFSRTGGFTNATNVDNVLTIPEYTGSDTVYAALYYSDGTRVTNESGTALSSVNVTLGAALPVLGTVTLNSPADITVGDPAVSYTATLSGDSTVTDETYSWSVSPGTAGEDYTITADIGDPSNATITFLTADTYTVTCTVSSVEADDTALGTDEIVVEAASSDYTDYIISGTSYWIIPAGTTTGQIEKTGGDASAVWTAMRHDSESGNSTTVQSGATVTMDASFPNVIQGGFNQLANPYNYCAAWFDGTGTGASDPRSSGWIIYEREQTAEALVGGRQSFLPIEVQDGVCGSGVTGSGFGPSWNLLGFDNSLVFFFNSYSAGSVQSWSPWDGSTTP